MSEQERLQAPKNSLASPGSAMHGIIQRKMAVSRYDNGPWHRLFLGQTFVADCRCEDDHHFPRHWTFPEALNALEAERDARREALDRAKDLLEYVADREAYEQLGEIKVYIGTYKAYLQDAAKDWLTALDAAQKEG